MCIRDRASGEPPVEITNLVTSYDVRGNVTLSSTYGSNQPSNIVKITSRYDHLGRLEYLSDPDKGVYEYVYNAYGELKYQIDAKQQKLDFTYDQLGRNKTKKVRLSNNSIESFTSWYYDDEDSQGLIVENALGQVTAIVQSKNEAHVRCGDASVDFCQKLLYDQYGKLQSETKVLGLGGVDGSYTNSVTYDSYGRVFEEFDVLNGLLGHSGTRHIYNGLGHETKLEDIGTGITIYEVNAVNERGDVIEAEVADGVIEKGYTYDMATGRILTQEAFALTQIQNIAYTWDVGGNLGSRTNMRYEGTVIDEKFCYDGLNRLRKTYLNPSQSASCELLNASQWDQKYDSLGNIIYKKGVGNFDYVNGQQGVRPHAVKKTAGSSNHTYQYDAKGNLISDTRDRIIEYSTFDKPISIRNTANTLSAAFTYGPDDSRWKRVNLENGNTATTLYLGAVEREIRSNTNTTKWTRYLGEHAIFTYVADQSGQLIESEKRFVFNDMLGSIDVMTDELGIMDDQGLMSFDAWGARRSVFNATVLTQSQLTSYENDFTRRGFTGHEMVDDFGIIHMNGRIYDPMLGRFMSADPIIQAQDNTQSYNRYSYVFNRPLVMTDPSGFVGESIDSSGFDYGSAVNLGDGNFIPSLIQIDVGAQQVLNPVGMLNFEVSIADIVAELDSAIQNGGGVVANIELSKASAELGKLLVQSGVNLEFSLAVAQVFPFSETETEFFTNSIFNTFNDEGINIALRNIYSSSRGKEVIDYINSRGFIDGVSILRNPSLSIPGNARASPYSKLIGEDPKFYEVWKKVNREDRLNLSIHINMESENPYFYKLNGEHLFLPSLTRVLAHEIGHIYSYAKTNGLSSGRHGAIKIENEIMRQLNPDAEIRHPEKGHSSTTLGL